jgi:Leucine-rich repeat (LRR) protein
MKIKSYMLLGWLLACCLAGPALAQKAKPKPVVKAKPAKTDPKAKPTKTDPKANSRGQTNPVVATPVTKPVAGTTLAPEKLADYDQRIRGIIEDMQAQFNALGDPDNSLSDKNTVINESYIDVYRDDKVQIEDDLVEGRSTAYNKNVKSYLQDIATFFGEAKFVLEVAKIDPPMTTEAGQLSFKVTLNRNLTATTKDGLPVNRTVRRYVEINLVNQAKDELKVASVYTSGAGGVAGLQFWWASLPPEWKTVGMGLMSLPDTVASEAQLKTLTETTTLDLSGRAAITDLAPLAQFKNIQHLDISNTGVEDLSPVRDLTKLVTLKAAGTKVLAIDALNFLVSLTEVNLDGAKLFNLKPLTNLVNLERLSLQNTLVRDLAPLAGATKLRSLRLAGSPVGSAIPLQGLRSLQILDLAGAKLTDLAPLQGLTALQELVLDNTDLKSVEDLQSLTGLKVLSLSGSAVASLDGLGKMPALQTIYADNTDLRRSSVLAHLAANPSCNVIFETAALRKWWKECPEPWKMHLAKVGNLSGEPSKEQLARLANLTELDLSGQAAINTLEPTKALPELTSLRARGTSVADATPLGRLVRLRELDLGQTKVADLKALATLADLEVLNVASTPVNSLAGLEKLAKLKLLYADSAAVSNNSKEVIKFIENQTNCLLIYKTPVLQGWWKGLSPEWQQIFGQYEKFTDPKNPSREGLHRLAILKKLDINGVRISNLQPSTILYRLEELSFTNTLVNDLTPVAMFARLVTLRFPKNPIGDLSPIGNMQSLRLIDCESTAIDNLEAIAGLTKLQELHFSGTQVKRLKGLETMIGLEVIEFYGTAVGNLKPIEGLPRLKRIRCHNTKLSKGDISSFKKAQPKCEVEHY